MMNDYKYSLSDLENMLPWEREIYATMLAQHIQKEIEKSEKRNRESL
jgi:hypothetical protein